MEHDSERAAAGQARAAAVRSVKRRFLVAALAAMLLPTAALAVQQTFLSTSQLQNGELVSLAANPQMVAPAAPSNGDSLVGVVAPPESSPVSTPAAAQQTYVTTNGVANALVSDIGGDIGVGDPIAVSVLVGTGAKTTASGRILGIAQASFDAKQQGATKDTVTDSAGKKRTVAVGRIPVLVNVTYWVAPAKTDTGQNVLPPFLQRFANLVAGKQTSPLPVLVSFILVAAGLIISGILLNSAIRSSIIAIGRNPLSTPTVRRSLIQAVLVAGSVIMASLAAAFVILRLL